MVKARNVMMVNAWKNRRAMVFLNAIICFSGDSGEKNVKKDFKWL